MINGYERVRFVASAESSRKSEISEFEHSGLGYEHIWRFQISMQDFVRMNIVKTVEQLLHYLKEIRFKNSGFNTR